MGVNFCGGYGGGSLEELEIDVVDDVLEEEGDGNIHTLGGEHQGHGEEDAGLHLGTPDVGGDQFLYHGGFAGGKLF